MERFQGRYRIPSNRMPGWDYSGHGIYFITLCAEGKECIFGFIEHKKMMLNHYGRIAEEEWIKSETIRREIELDAFVIMPNHVHGIVILHPTYIGNVGGEYVDGIDDINGHIGKDGHVETHGPVETHGRASLRADGIGRANDIKRAKDNERADDNERANDIKRANDNERDNGNEYADDPGHVKSNTPVADNNDHSNHPRFHRKSKSLSSFIAGYKSSVTTRINNFIDSCNAKAPFYPETHGRLETHGRASLRAKYSKSNRLWQPNYYDHIIRNDEEYMKIKEYIQDNPSKWKDDRFYK